MKPVITEPSEGIVSLYVAVDNDGYDNVNSDYIFRKGDIITNEKKNLYHIYY
jgi:hypothetical protein